MSSDLKPCPENKQVYLDHSSHENTLYICLVEDRRVKKEELKKNIREEITRRGLGKDHVSFNPEKIVEHISNFLNDLREAIKKSIIEIHGKTGPIDISLPSVSDEAINPGEFAGNFAIYNTDNNKVILHIEPKIGWHGYIKMLQETRQSIDLLTSKTGVLEPLLGNLYYPFLSSPISYSILLLRLTELILTSSLPKKTISVEVVSEGVVGRPIMYKTLKYLLMGYPLGVYERIKIVLHDYPFILLAKFHYDLSTRLFEILDILNEAIKYEPYYWLLTDKINTLRNLHVHYLTTPPLNSFFNLLLKEEIPDQELLKQTRRAARTNPYFGLLADLYEIYTSNIGLVHEYVEKGEIIPSASSKIYELWILTRITGFLENMFRAPPSVEKYRDLYIIIRFGWIRLIYNMPRYGFFLKKLQEHGVLAKKKARLRPDFILKTASKAIVYDAKYKLKIAVRDVVTLLAYIAEYARPITMKNEKILLGAFYKLASDPRSYKEPYQIVKNHALPMKVAIYLYTLDPRMPKDKIENTIKQSLQPLLKKH